MLSYAPGEAPAPLREALREAEREREGRDELLPPEREAAWAGVMREIFEEARRRLESAGRA